STPRSRRPQTCGATPVWTSWRSSGIGAEGAAMYGEHFGLTADPFSLTPDPAFLYLSSEHREALAAVQYGLLDGRGFITLIGEVGTGKTTLLYSILSRRHADLTAAYLSYSAQSFEDLMAAALRDLGVPTEATSKRAL